MTNMTDENGKRCRFCDSVDGKRHAKRHARKMVKEIKLGDDKSDF